MPFLPGYTAPQPSMSPYGASLISLMPVKEFASLARRLGGVQAFANFANMFAQLAQQRIAGKRAAHAGEQSGSWFEETFGGAGGAGLGAGLGAGIGALLALPTGGLSVAGGALTGAGIGTGIGAGLGGGGPGANAVAGGIQAATMLPIQLNLLNQLYGMGGMGGYGGTQGSYVGELQNPFGRVPSSMLMNYFGY